MRSAISTATTFAGTGSRRPSSTISAQSWRNGASSGPAGIGLEFGLRGLRLGLGLGLGLGRMMGTRSDDPDRPIRGNIPARSHG